ncbi:MAG: DEAD/DEAH box helicase [Pseudomonadota bacterium]
MKFSELGLAAELLEAIGDQGYDQPSPIQQKAIPEVLAGRDVMAAAQTGTGKTAGFTLPILDYLSRTPKPQGKGNQVRSLILTPTRELAAQIAASVETYGRYQRVKSVVVFGGVKINPQMQRLRGGADVLIATPGRLLDLHQQNAIQFDKLEVLVLDEADRMLDMGFIHDICRIVQKLPKKRQTLLFSATFSNEIRQLAKSFLHKPVEISVSAPNTTVDTVKQKLIAVEKADKLAVLAHLITKRNWFQVLVFSRTKHGANKLSRKLNNRGIEAAAIHGNKSQGARTRALADFKANKCRVLVATDIAARGIDIDQLPHVVNFDLPQVAEDYVHRIGRTGRAGSSGEAISLVSHDEFKMLVEIEKLIRKKIPREVLDGFEPLNNLPESPAKFTNSKKKKPKKKRPNTSNQRESSKSDKGVSYAPGSRKKRSSHKRRRPARNQAASKQRAKQRGGKNKPAGNAN